MSAPKVYGVFQWTDGTEDHHGGGYVVRTSHDGYYPAPYSTETPVKEFTREYLAQRCADKLNNHPSEIGIVLVRKATGEVIPAGWKVIGA